MSQETVEDYLGAIYRLGERAAVPVPLARLQEYFGFSPISIHEMVRKLAERALVTYQPYRGVTLTEAGRAQATALLRRHRLWERFLTDLLAVPWDEAHEIAGALEHAAPQAVTERLAHLLGEPERCPHGGAIPPQPESPHRLRLSEAPLERPLQILCVSPEVPALLRQLRAIGLLPGLQVRLVERTGEALMVEQAGQRLTVGAGLAQVVWVILEDESSSTMDEAIGLGDETLVEKNAHAKLS